MRKKTEGVTLGFRYTSNSGGTSSSSDTYFPFFLRWRTHSERRYSICPFTERKSSSAHAAIALYSFGESRRGICFFWLSFIRSPAFCFYSERKSIKTARIDDGLRVVVAAKDD